MGGELGQTSRNPLNLWLPLAAAAVLLAVGYYPTRWCCGEAGIRAMAAAVCIVVGVVYATLLVIVRRLARGDPAARLKASLKAAAVRMVLTIVVAGLVAWKAWVKPGPFLVWLAISYVLLIKIETLMLLRRTRPNEKRT